MTWTPPTPCRHPPSGVSTAARRAVGGAVAAVLALTVAACGAEPPQAPLAEAKKIDTATSAISTACGKAYLLTAFGGSHVAGLKGPDHAASSSARTLALIDHRDPDWVYQGETVRTIVHDSVSMLGSCGLRPVRARLLRETARH
jgi:hypothetical protein